MYPEMVPSFPLRVYVTGCEGKNPEKSKSGILRNIEDIRNIGI
jgi:hypothetical protein